MQMQVKPSIKPLINSHAPKGEEARVDAVFSAVQQKFGFVPAALKLYGVSPSLLESFVGNIGYYMSGERIPPSLMTMIRYLVSSDANCHFCIDMNEGFLTSMGFDLNAIRAARSNHEAAPVPAKEKPLLMIALKSVNTPDKVDSQDIQSAKAQGWTDRDIFEAVSQAASNRALNYVLRTFKVETQDSFA